MRSINPPKLILVAMETDDVITVRTATVQLGTAGKS